ncbi:MAG: bifunctional 4-hydroxy-2-oxoglutarate aldolase/2-dehydro-3-deoxy-phosphogluconate aldolase [Luteitalea sp.]|nr:bifunctional 4-hydroxy-2-oxoglutarate aldolase/2-dehydro-3-deoxy-phosphogluconate aldolase [Luteitalea sp.]
MTSRVDIVREIENSGVVAIIRMQDPGRVRAVFDALAEGGVRALEVTMTVPGAMRLIEEIAASLPSGLVLGAGTVLDPETARHAILAGARFIVAPVLHHGVIELCHRYDVAVVPGCFSPTEILSAWQAGADVVKVFPASALGTGFVRDLRGPLPQIKILPTGGVSLENVGEWIKSGACAVGVGSAMLDPKAIAEGRYEVLTANARRVVESIRTARAGR